MPDWVQALLGLGVGVVVGNALKDAVIAHGWISVVLGIVALHLFAGAGWLAWQRSRGGDE